ncbi:hypothetical protein PHYPSEUDO_005246 [Phytophthora pseudosyringae]|uniref:Carbohydrate binding module family 25 domain-containing protein n=1 Tax=Phytophthora pseudosyringae TaxID=221518 RepID=A0A8T1WCA5_9STRA|nr:hypothetical protein PHYPSEUDO_005246 [Phytophthora pseudosyringae]
MTPPPPSFFGVEFTAPRTSVKFVFNDGNGGWDNNDESSRNVASDVEYHQLSAGLELARPTADSTSAPFRHRPISPLPMIKGSGTIPPRHFSGWSTRTTDRSPNALTSCTALLVHRTCIYI